MTEILHCNLENAARNGEKESEEEKNGNEEAADSRGLKRKFESNECSDDSKDESVQGKKELGKLKIAKNVGIICVCL